MTTTTTAAISIIFDVVMQEDYSWQIFVARLFLSTSLGMWAIDPLHDPLGPLNARLRANRKAGTHIFAARLRFLFRRNREILETSALFGNVEG
jgi:hypothetical protein